MKSDKIAQLRALMGNDGPWGDEPDGPVYFAHVGYKCLLKRNDGFAWCGYVGVSVEHELFGKTCWSSSQTNYSNLIANFEVHGGVTFCDSASEIDAENKMEGLWLIGFDCSHAYDISPGYEAQIKEALGKVIFPENLNRMFENSNCVYRDFEYARDETRRLAEQISGMIYH
jgi:hypothetical protein